MDYGMHGSCDKALHEARTEAARYKAERDVAVQESERLRRELAERADGRLERGCTMDRRLVRFFASAIGALLMVLAALLLVWACVAVGAQIAELV